MNSKKNWAFILHVDNPHLYLPVLEYQKKKSIREVKGLCNLFKKMNIPSNAKILDLSCGIGNHSIPLAKQGYDVTGYDPSSFYLNTAIENSKRLILDEEKRPKFILGDPYQPAKVLIQNQATDFDVVLIMDNSFGYSSEYNDFNLLRKLLKIANKNCILIIETENRDWRLANFEYFTFFNSDKIEILGQWKFNFETSVSTGVTKFYKKENKDSKDLRLLLKIDICMRLYSLHEMKNLLHKSGWDYIKSYDDIALLKIFENDSMSLFTVSTIHK
jgi:SAM-dependent methyltransferase